MSRLVPLLVMFAMAGALAACGDSETNAPAGTGPLPEHVTVSVGDTTFAAEVSETSAERTLGLGERDSLDGNAGMLFVFNGEAEHTFWMKGMRFPLDFVWISADRRVVAITEDVPPPEAGTASSDLEQFDADVGTQYVLEMNAGEVAERAIAVGDPVTFQPDIDPALAE